MSSATLKAGAEVGPYRLVKELGSGSQGTVWLAEDTRLPRKVALKTLYRPGFAPEILGSHVRSFRNEAELTARLEHPGICTIYDAGVSGQTAYIAMRHVPGQTLWEWRGSHHPRTWAEISRILAVFEQIALALHAAHEAGVVHRDLSPLNIMVMKNDAPVILDFGIAQLVEDTGVVPAGGPFEGALPYMAPEQIAPERVNLDRRSDLYSLAAVLYEHLTFRKPSEAPPADLHLAIMTQPAVNACKVNKRLAFEIGAVLDKALSKHRNARYANAREIAEDLGRIRRFEIIAGRPTPPHLRAVRFVQRNPKATVAALGFLLLAALLIAALAWARAERLAYEREHTARLLSEARAKIPTDPALAWRLVQEASAIDRESVEIGNIAAEIAMELRGRRFLVGHTGPVVDVAFNAGADRVLTASRDGTARTWIAETGEPSSVLSLPDPQAERIWAVGWSEGSPIVATQTRDLFVHVRSSSGRRFEPERPGAVLTAACISGNGRHLATLANATARLREISGARSVVLREEEAGEQVLALSFSTDDSNVVTVGNDGKIRIWPVSGASHRTIQPKSGKAWQASLGPGPESFQLATAEHAGMGDTGPGQFASPLSIAFKSFPDGSWHEVGEAKGPIVPMAWARQGLLLTAGAVETALWDVTRRVRDPGCRISTLRHDSETGAARFSQDGRLVATGLDDGRTIVWNTDEIERLPLKSIPFAYDRDSRRIVAVQLIGPANEPQPSNGFVSPRGTHFLAPEWDPPTIHETKTGDPQGKISRGIGTATFSDDGAVCAVLDERGVTAQIYRVSRQTKADNELTPIISIGPGSRPVKVLFGPDSHRFIAYRHHEAVTLWDADGPASRPVCDVGENVSQAQFNPKGHQVATMPDPLPNPSRPTESRPVARLWSVEGTREPIPIEDPRPEEPPRLRTILAFTSDGKYVAVESAEEVCVHDTGTGRIVQRLSAAGAWSGEFNRTGNVLLTILANETACVWDWRANRRSERIPCPRDSVARFGGDGGQVVVAPPSQPVKIWSSTTAREVWSPVERAKALGLTPDLRWAVIQIEGCTEKFKLIPIDPLREAADMIGGPSRGRAAHSSSSVRQFPLR